MGCASSRCAAEPPLPVATTAPSPADDDGSMSVNDDSLGSAQPQPQRRPPATPPLAAASPGKAAAAGPALAPPLEPPASEEERLELVAALRRAQPGERFGPVTGLLGTYFDVQLAFVSMIDEHEVVSLPCEAPPFSAPRGTAVCEWPLSMPHETLLVVEDLARDPRFQNAPCITGEPLLRFYAAAALRCSSGTLGALCIADRQPRTFSPDQLDFLLRCAGMVVQNVETEAAAVRELRRLRRKQEQRQEDGRQQQGGPSREELHSSIQGSADATLVCSLGQQPWAVLACNAASAALADLPQPLPDGLLFSSLFEVVPGSPGSSTYQQAVARRQCFTLTCRLLPAAERPPGCSASGDSSGQAGAAAVGAPRSLSGPGVLLRSASASDASASPLRRPASGTPLSAQLPALGEQQAAVAGPDALQSTAGDGAQAVAAVQEPLAGRGSLDSTLPPLKRKQAPDQLYAVAFAPCTPGGLEGSSGAGGAALPPLLAAAGQPLPWLATLCPKNLAATAAQARLGLLIGRHQRQQAAAANVAGSCRTGPSSPSGVRPRPMALPRVLLPENMQDVELGRLLGAGANGRTYAARWQGSRVAVKCVELRDREPEAALPEYAQQALAGGSADPGATALVEAVLSKALRHPHIVTTHAYGICESGRHMGTCYNEVWIVQDLCTMGPLLRAIERGRFKQEDGTPRLLFVVLTAAEIAGALAYLHSKGVVHGDMSSNNVLLNPSTKDQRLFVAMVSDFGLARPLEVLTQLSTDTYGTISYMPPELLLHQKLSPAVDVYSIGVLLWELMSGCRAWEGMSSLQILAAVTTGRRLEVNDSWPRAIKSLIARCLDSNPRQRPSAKEVLEELECMLGGQPAQ